MKRHLFISAVFLAVAGALVLRLPGLSQRPMHTDEAVNAVKFGALLENNQYRYDPYEYHGPTLYYFTLPAAWPSSAHNLTELTEVALRIIPVIFGVATIFLLVLVADGLGRSAAVGAAILTAVSPAMVFYHRYYIHESLLVFFSFLVIVSVWRYSRRQSIGWLLSAAAAAGLMHATKETCIIAFAAMLLALLLSRIFGRRVEILGGAQDDKSGAQNNKSVTWDDKSGVKNDKVIEFKNLSSFKVKHLIAALLVGTAVSFLLYSSFLTNLSGPLDSLKTYVVYLDRADGRGVHEHPWYYYLKILTYYKDAPGPFFSEGMIAALSLAGIIAALSGKGISRSNIRLGRFFVFYTLIMTMVYSIIPYKTPWCMLGFLHGMIILAGVGAGAMIKTIFPISVKVIVSLLLIAGAGQLTFQAYQTNFRFFADYRNPYVYAHTVRDVKQLAGLAENIAQVHPEGKDMTIKIVAEPDNYWPLPWYLRRFGRVGYWDEPPDQVNEPLVIASEAMQPGVEEKLPGSYHAEYFGLRPTVRLKVYIRNDLWEAFIKQQQMKN